MAKSTFQYYVIRVGGGGGSEPKSVLYDENMTEGEGGGPRIWTNMTVYDSRIPHFLFSLCLDYKDISKAKFLFGNSL